MDHEACDVAIVGAGPAGLTLALGIAATAPQLRVKVGGWCVHSCKRVSVCAHSRECVSWCVHSCKRVSVCGAHPMASDVVRIVCYSAPFEETFKPSIHSFSRVHTHTHICAHRYLSAALFWHPLEQVRPSFTRSMKDEESSIRVGTKGRS